MAFEQTERPSAGEEPSQSIVIPAFNEAFRIEQTLDSVSAYLDSRDYESECILVDDGSTDETGRIAGELSRWMPSLKVISIPHQGKAVAVRQGLKMAEGDLILFTDADLATPITYLDRFREAAAEGYDVVIGSREGAEASRIGEPLFRHVMGRGFNAMVRALLLPGINDTQCGFKLFTHGAARELLDRSLLYRNHHERIEGAKVTAFDVELLVVAKRLGYRIKVMPVMWTFGERSKVDPASDTLTNLHDVLQVKWNDLRGRYD